VNLKPKDRESIRIMFGGRCAYCGCELSGKWHVDHIEAVYRDGHWEHGKWKLNGNMLRPENDTVENLFPSCIKCNILKSNGNIETFRSNLTHFAHSIPTIRTYSHVHHLMRFGKLSIDTTPVVFWFEKWKELNNDTIHEI
jgi:hypothetical protein